MSIFRQTPSDTGGTTGDRDAVLSLADDVRTWSPGDKVVVASSDYDMNHAEVFTLGQCSGCPANQVKIHGLLFSHSFIIIIVINILTWPK